MAKNEQLAAALAPRKADLLATRERLQQQLAPLQAEYDALLAKIQPLEAQLRELGKRIKALEQPAARDIGNELAAIERAIGARTLTNDGQ